MIDAIETMEAWLKEWVPEGSEVRLAGSRDPSRELIGWRIEFPDGVVARVSFSTSDVEHAQDR